MKYPSLVLGMVCRTETTLILEREGLNKTGAPLPAFVWKGLCNYQDKARRILTDDKKIVEITGTILIPGDICPSLPVISGGTALIYGVSRRISRGTKARNPDGTVNYTEVLLE